jgi:GTP-binding protein
MKPVIALVGRPNVGKSTLFNRLTKSRDAIVADFAGLTRDRHYGEGRMGSHEYIVVDTGGFEPDCVSGIVKEMAKQTRQAVAEADVVIFVVDARNGLSAQDHDIARYLRTTNKKVLLAANKSEGMKEGVQLAEFYELGMGEPIPVSSAHGQGIRSLLDEALAEFIEEEDEDEEALDDPERPIRLAVAGRPNVGKSTLINTWLGEERLVAFDMPGTTRDAISVPFEREGQKFELIDTAGLRRKGKVFEAIEKFSVVKTLQAISDANVVLLLIDATQGVTEQDAHIAGFVLEAGRAVVIAVNKWDAVDSYQRELLMRSIEHRLSFLKFAPVLHISAIKRQGLGPLWKSIAAAWALRRLQDADAGAHAPAAGSRAVPATQEGRRLPTQVALRPPGRAEPAGHRGPRQFAGARHRRLQALPRRAFPRALQAHGHPFAHRNEIILEPLHRGVRRNTTVSDQTPRQPKGSGGLC